MSEIIYLYFAGAFFLMSFIYFAINSLYNNSVESSSKQKSETPYSFYPVSIFKFIHSEHDFKNLNINSYIEQDYPKFEIIFVLKKHAHFCKSKLENAILKTKHTQIASVVFSSPAIELIKKAQYDFILVDHHTHSLCKTFLKKMMDFFSHGVGVLNLNVNAKKNSIFNQIIFNFINSRFKSLSAQQILFKKTLVDRFGGQRSITRLMQPKVLERELLMQMGLKKTMLPHHSAFRTQQRVSFKLLRDIYNTEKTELKKNKFLYFIKKIFMPHFMLYSIFLALIYCFESIYYLQIVAISLLITSIIYMNFFSNKKSVMNLFTSFLFILLDLFTSILQWIVIFNVIILKPVFTLLKQVQFRNKVHDKLSWHSQNL